MATRDPENLYAVLGLDPTAAARDIKKAYRRLAMDHHPDRNPGDDAADAMYKAVTFAYEVLSDPDRRAVYDRTGDPGGGPVPSPDARLLSVLIPCLMEVLVALANNRYVPLSHADVLGELRGFIRRKQKEHTKKRQEVEATRRALAPVLDRLTTTGDTENLLTAGLRVQLRTLDEAAATFGRDLEIMADSLTHLDGYHYRRERSPLANPGAADGRAWNDGTFDSWFGMGGTGR